MSSSSYQSSAEVPAICGCGVPVARKQSWTSRNPWRRFVTCKFSNQHTTVQGCGLFMWVDEPQQEWQRLVINQLVLEKKLMARQIDHLKLQVCTLEDQKGRVDKNEDTVMHLKQELESLKLKNKESSKFFVAIVVGAMTGIAMYLVLSLLIEV